MPATPRPVPLVARRLRAVAGATCNYTGNRAEASELLRWVNAYLGKTYGKVADLSSGAAYWQFTGILFAGAVELSNVNLMAQRGCNSMQNFEVL